MYNFFDHAVLFYMRSTIPEHISVIVSDYIYDSTYFVVSDSVTISLLLNNATKSRSNSYTTEIESSTVNTGENHTVTLSVDRISSTDQELTLPLDHVSSSVYSTSLLDRTSSALPSNSSILSSQSDHTIASLSSSSLSSSASSDYVSASLMLSELSSKSNSDWTTQTDISLTQKEADDASVQSISSLIFKHNKSVNDDVLKSAFDEV